MDSEIAEKANDIEISINIEDLRSRKLFVATPMYGGQCSGIYTRSVIDLVRITDQLKIEVDFNYLFNESLITRARNYLADEFLRSNCTHLLFIDSDIGFDPNDVITLLALADSDRDIICAPYPKKNISWEKIKRAVDKGLGDKNAEDLAKYVGDYVFNPVGDQNSIPLFRPVEVLESGTGFMMIQRHVLERFAERYPNLRYVPDHVRTEHFDGSREIVAFFDALIDDKNSNIIQEIEMYIQRNGSTLDSNDLLAFIRKKNTGLLRNYSNRYLSEDYMFCQWVRNIGMKVWLCPWMKLNHVGQYIFGGSLPDLAQAGVSATAHEFMEKKVAQKKKSEVKKLPLVNPNQK